MDIAQLEWQAALAVIAVLCAGLVGYGLFRLTRAKAGKAESAVTITAPPTSPAATPPVVGDPTDKTSFALRQFMVGVQAELDQLREEITQLKNEVALLKVIQGTAPQYNDAVQLAKADTSPTAIADECGISVAEAELVLALVRHGVKGES